MDNYLQCRREAVRCVMRAIVSMLREHGNAGADELRRRIALSLRFHPTCYASAWRALQAMRVIGPVQLQHARRKVARGAKQYLWAIVDEVAADAVLEEQRRCGGLVFTLPTQMDLF